MDRWTQYLFERHSEAQLRAWAVRLAFFRFFRAFGGHANDGDSLDVAFAYHGADQLVFFFAQLGIELFRFSDKPSQPELGVTYRGSAFSSFPSLIPGTRWIRQPGHCEVGGVGVFIWCGADQIKISLSDAYEVTEQNVADAEKVEMQLGRLDFPRVDPPLDTHNYICPQYYPQYFSD